MERRFLDEMNENLRDLVESHPEMKPLYKDGEKLNERYLNKEDPSFVMNEYLTEAKAILTDLELVYAQSASNRNSLDTEAAPLMRALLDKTASTMKALRYAPIEDANI